MRLLKTSTLTITRDQGNEGYWDERGRWVANSATTTFSIQCNIQPFKMGKTEVVLPEGISAKDAIVVRTKTPLNTAEQLQDKRNADTTVFQGSVYEAFFDENWDLYGLKTDHHKVTFIRKDQETGGSL